MLLSKKEKSNRFIIIRYFFAILILSSLIKKLINTNTMARNQARASADGYCIQILLINGNVNKQSEKLYNIENIGKGGFRFISEMPFELDDRVKVLLRFPDEFSQEVLGRICYREENTQDHIAYGFSVIDGFYSLR